MSSRSGELVRWNAVNGVVEGKILDYMGNGEWLIEVEGDKRVIVNEASFIDGKGIRMA